MPSVLEIRNLHVTVEDKPILKGLNLTVKQGETHALMGPNGTGKSTLAYTLMGHPNYVVTGGEIIFKGVNLLDLKTDERARLGLFLAFQYPVAIPGVSVANFLRTAINTRRRALNPADKVFRFRNPTSKQALVVLLRDLITHIQADQLLSNADILAALKEALPAETDQ